MGLVELGTTELLKSRKIPPDPHDTCVLERPRVATAESPSDSELIRERAERGLEDIWFFQQDILDVGKDDDMPRDEAEIRPMLEWFDQPRPSWWRPQKRFLLYSSFPRFTGKSYCLATLCTQAIVIDPNIAIMIMCELKEMAVGLIDLIRRWLEAPKLVQCYGSFRPKGKGWSGEIVTVAQQTTPRKDPTLIASGMDVPSQGKHPNILIWDDLVGDTNDNLQGYKKVNKRMADSMPVLRQGGFGIFNGTRYGEEDPAGAILEKSFKGWAKDAPESAMWIAPPGRGFFGAYAEPGDEEFFKARAQVIVPGEPLFPTILPEAEIESYRQDWPFDHFSSQILNDPAPIEGRIFHRKNYQYFDPYKKDPSKPDTFSDHLIDELKEGFCYMAIDPAGGKEHTERGDDSVLGCGFIRWNGPSPQLWMVDAIGGRFKPDVIIDHFFTMFERWSPVKIFAEVNILKEWLLHPLRLRARTLGIHLPFPDDKGVSWGKGDAKKERIKTLVNPYIYRQVFHSTNLKNSKLEIQQAQYQPGGKGHDDWLDMEAMLWIKGTGGRKKKRRPGEGMKVGSFGRGRIRYQRTGV